MCPSYLAVCLASLRIVSDLSLQRGLLLQFLESYQFAQPRSPTGISQIDDNSLPHFLSSDLGPPRQTSFGFDLLMFQY